MADAEPNLVPTEAADQVEVALEAQAAADDAKNKAQKAMNRSQGKTGTAAKK